ncbi:MAG: hypothetical protein JOZ63_13940, partial [Planctomycetaceae bacterium]|nr:hypothetical protein [Planctomycetaceae bacterium]
AATGDWLFELVAGPVIGRQPAQLSLEAILGRRVSHLRKILGQVADQGPRSAHESCPFPPPFSIN